MAAVSHTGAIVAAAALSIAACAGTEVDSVPDAGPAFDARAEADAAGATSCTRTWVDLLANGHFDDGAAGWVTETNGGQIVREEGAGYPWSVHSGTWGAILLGFNNGVQRLSQTVAIPESTTRLRLQAYRCFVTEETADVVYDTLSVELQSGAVTREVLLSADNTGAGAVCNWGFVLAESSAALAGETLDFAIVASSDVASVSSFGLDTLSLEALACP